MLKLMRFFRRERSSTDVSKLNEVAKGMRSISEYSFLKTSVCVIFYIFVSSEK